MANGGPDRIPGPFITGGRREESKQEGTSGGREGASGRCHGAALRGHVPLSPPLRASGHVPSETSQPAMEARPPSNRGGGNGCGHCVSASSQQRL